MAQVVGLEAVIQRLQELLAHNKLDAAAPLLWPSLDQFPRVPALWFFAGVFMHRTGSKAIAIACWQRAYELEPSPLVFGNIGAALRDMGEVEASRAIMLHGLTVSKNDQPILTNLTGAAVNEGDPWTWMEYGHRAIANDPSDRRALFNLALLQLEAGLFEPGFRNYASGQHANRTDPHPDHPSIKLTPDTHAIHKGRGRRLLVWGEQGIGDELMFATILEQACHDYTIVFDCHPRLESLHRSAAWFDHPHEMHPTRKTDDKPWLKAAHIDLRCGIGDLAQLYRADGKFPSPPFYGAPQWEIDQMREMLRSLAGGRKIIGLALRGGTIQTSRRYRTISPDDIAPLLKRDDCIFVSLDYEDVTPMIVSIGEKYAPGRIFWYPSVTFAWDYHHVASMVSATDAVVTVCQSVAHLSAAMAHPTHVLVPSKPAWRYGASRDPAPEPQPWFWYPHDDVRLYRQRGDDWAPAVEQVNKAIGGSSNE